MVFHHLSELADLQKKNAVCRRAAVAGAANTHVMQAVVRAGLEGIVTPVLVGDEEKIREVIRTLDPEERDAAETYEIVRADSPEECGETAVRLVREGSADFIMKGLIQTRDVLKPLVKKENGLNLGKTMCVFSYNEVPRAGRLLAISDGGMIPYPTLEQKKDILTGCVETLHRLGIERPSVAVLTAVEKVNPKMPETLDAQELVRMNRDGEITGCDVVGPISYDIAMSREAAAEKGYECRYSGDFDCVIVPSLVAGNLMNKAILVTAGGKMAGVVIGAKVPVALSSRGATAEEKYDSLVLASMIS